MTLYLVHWPAVGVVKFGISNYRRWEKFQRRGADLIQLHKCAGAFELESVLHAQARQRWDWAFTNRADARPYLGGNGAGWRECFTATADEARRMLGAYARAHAQSICPQDAQSMCPEHMPAHMPAAHAEENRTEDGRTDNRNHSRSKQKLTVCTRTREGEVSEMTINPATPQLCDLAAAMRPDWDRDQITLALAAAKNAGWTWTRTLTAAVQLLCDVKATPRDLAAAARSPLERTTPADPASAAAALAGMRAALKHAGDAS